MARGTYSACDAFQAGHGYLKTQQSSDPTTF